MKILVAKLFIATLVLAGTPTFGMAKTTSTITPTSSCDCSYRVDGHDYNVHKIYLNRGHVHIYLRGDGDTDLDLYIYSDGEEVARRVSRRDVESVGLTMHSSGYVRVKVKNLGHVHNVYQLWTS